MPPFQRLVRTFLRAQNWRLLAAFVYGTLLVYLFILIDFRHAIPDSIAWFESLNAIQRSLFFIAVGLSIPTMLPTTPFEIGAGVLFPWVLGAAGCVLAQTVGACIALLLARHWFPPAWRAGLLRQRRFAQLSHVLHHGGWRMVMLTRLTPMFPVKITNYAFGLSHVRLGDFFLGTLLGIAPRVTLYVYLGSLAGQLLKPGQGPELSWPWLLVAGLLTIGCLVLISLKARKSLRHYSDAKVD